LSLGAIVGIICASLVVVPLGVGAGRVIYLLCCPDPDPYVAPDPDSDSSWAVTRSNEYL
jgi:hypothetical protein